MNSKWKYFLKSWYQTSFSVFQEKFIWMQNWKSESKVHQEQNKNHWCASWKVSGGPSLTWLTEILFIKSQNYWIKCNYCHINHIPRTVTKTRKFKVPETNWKCKERALTGNLPTFILYFAIGLRGLPTWLSCGSVVKNHLPMQETQEVWVQSLGWEDPLEKGMAIHSSILAWEILWSEEPGGYNLWGLKGQTQLNA